MLVRAIFVINLILGILFWTDHADSLKIAHILLGIVFVASLWLIGVMQALKGGSIGLTLGTFVMGLILAIVGLFQNGTLIIQIIHLLLAVLALGLAEMAAARYRKLAAA